MQIMGIWKEKQKELAKVKTERTNLKKKQEQFNAQKGKLIKSAIAKTINQYEVKLRTLRTREKQIEKQANLRVRKAVSEAHTNAKLKGEKQIAKLEKKLSNSMKRQIKNAESKAKVDAKAKYNELPRAKALSIM
jgi:predicted  nucleic acid-binding Zn-ribbon protein